jgi:hypothetical protein
LASVFGQRSFETSRQVPSCDAPNLAWVRPRRVRGVLHRPLLVEQLKDPYSAPAPRRQSAAGLLRCKCPSIVLSHREAPEALNSLLFRILHKPL